jgi:hypothetical protein
MPVPQLFIPNKQKSADDPSVLPAAWRTLERWAAQIVTAVAAAGGYKSLTGPGQTATPGNLTQQGGFDVEAPSGGSGVTLRVNNFGPADTSAMTIYNANGNGGTLIEDNGGGGITITSTNTGSGGFGTQINGNGVQLNDSAPAGQPGINFTSPNNRITVNAPAGFYIANSTGTPSVPSGGGVLFTQLGALKYIGSSGTVTTIAVA